MLKGWKFEEVTIGTRSRCTCEVVAYYELEKFVTAA